MKIGAAIVYANGVASNRVVQCGGLVHLEVGAGACLIGRMGETVGL